MMASTGAVIFWIDEMLPPALADWVNAQSNVSACHFRARGFHETPDRDVFLQARDQAAVIVSKDGDFANLVMELGAPPQVLWVRTGNVRTKALLQLFETQLTSLIAHLQEGAALIALGY